MTADVHFSGHGSTALRTIRNFDELTRDIVNLILTFTTIFSKLINLL